MWLLTLVKFWLLHKNCCQVLLKIDTQRDPDDLTFVEGDIMTVLTELNEHKWIARHTNGRQGKIPANYVEVSFTH